jgi:hypothetical protein
VRRVSRDHGLRPWLAETFKLSNDPRFEKKLAPAGSRLVRRLFTPDPAAPPRPPGRRLARAARPM